MDQLHHHALNHRMEKDSMCEYNVMKDKLNVNVNNEGNQQKRKSDVVNDEEEGYWIDEKRRRLENIRRFNDPQRREMLKMRKLTHEEITNEYRSMCGMGRCYRYFT